MWDSGLGVTDRLGLFTLLRLQLHRSLPFSYSPPPRPVFWVHINVRNVDGFWGKRPHTHDFFHLRH